MEEENSKVEEKENCFDNILLFKYGDRTLRAWVDFFSIDIPKLPSSSLEMSNSIVELNNKYQIAYNNLSIINVQLSSAEKKYRDAKDKLISSLINEYKEKGVTRMPARETLEIAILNNDKNSHLIKLQKKYEIYQMVRDFFDCHKNKLEKVMKLFSDISYSVNASDRMNATPK